MIYIQIQIQIPYTYMCKGSVSKEKVLADLSSLKRLSRLINETETNSESLMQREFCAKKPVHIWVWL